MFWRQNKDKCTTLSVSNIPLIYFWYYKSEDSDAVYHHFAVTLLISYAKEYHILTGKAIELKIEIFIRLDLDDEIHFKRSR